MITGGFLTHTNRKSLVAFKVDVRTHHAVALCAFERVEALNVSPYEGAVGGYRPDNRHRAEGRVLFECCEWLTLPATEMFFLDR